MLKHLKKTDDAVFCRATRDTRSIEWNVTTFPTEVTCIRCLAFAVEHHERRAWTAEAKLEDVRKILEQHLNEILDRSVDAPAPRSTTIEQLYVLIHGKARS